MKILTIPLPPIMTNCYIVYEKDGGKCFIIDPASSADRISAYIESFELKPKAILLTHGHFDHIAASDELREKYKIPLYVHEYDSEMILSPILNCSRAMIGSDVALKPADVLLKDGDSLKLEKEKIIVLHTPGHSPGSCAFVGVDFAFSGDTVFKGTYGRYDLPGGNYDLLMSSVKKIMSLNPITELYPGHDEKTTVSEEMLYY